jgi:hypothetical protein
MLKGREVDSHVLNRYGQRQSPPASVTATGKRSRRYKVRLWRHCRVWRLHCLPLGVCITSEAEQAGMSGLHVGAPFPFRSSFR